MSTRLGTSDYTEMAVKPDNNDGFGVFDTSVNTHKSIYYSTLKGLFVKIDETDTITANKILQTNNYFYFGSSLESFVRFDGTDMIIGPTAVAPTAKLKLRCNAADFLVLDPVNSSIKIGTKAINYDGSASVGINFDASNRPVLLSVLQCNAGIALKAQHLSYSGAAGTGLEFSVTNVATFNQQVNCDDIVNVGSTLNVTGQINANKAGEWSIAADGKSYFADNIKLERNKCINDSGANSTGMSHSSAAGDLITMHGDLGISGSTTAVGGVALGLAGALTSINTGDAISISGNCKIGSGKKYKVGASDGASFTFDKAVDNTITFVGGIATGKT